ncbi:MAG TPA: glycosyltransferase [Gammaproteobacteria bacterium]
MRILMVSDVYFPRVNGVSTSIQTFNHELRKRGHEIVLLAPEYPQGPADDETDIVRIPARRVIMDPEDRMMFYRNILQRTAALKEHPFDILHIQTPFVAHYAGIRLARALNIPVVETYHTLFEEYLFHYLPFLPRSALRLAARQFTRSQCNGTDAVIAPSGPMRDVLRRYGVSNRIEVIPTGMQMERFNNGDGARFRAQYRIPADRPTLVHVGRIAHEKNIDFLIHTLAEVRKAVPDVLLIIAGEGPALEHLRRLVGLLKLQDNVLFVGYLSRNGALLDCYRAGNVFVFASRTETQGLVLLEAMALAVPVVSTAVMGTKDILDAGKGALIAEDNLQDFSDKVVKLLNNSELRKQLGEEAKEYAATWSASALAEKMQTLYLDLIEKHGRH